MNSPQIVKALIVAAIFAVIAYLVTTFVAANAITTTVMVFIAALAATFFVQTSNEEASADVKTLYVGNLPYRANEVSVRELFSQYGTVLSVRLMKDKHTGKRRGFGFVEISANDAESAIAALNDKEFQQRTLKVREAKDRPDKSDDEE